MCLRHTRTHAQAHACPHRGWRRARAHRKCAKHPLKRTAGSRHPENRRPLAWICEKYAWEFERLRMSLWCVSACVCVCVWARIGSGCLVLSGRAVAPPPPFANASADNFVMARRTRADSPTHHTHGQYTCYVWLGDVSSCPPQRAAASAKCANGEICACMPPAFEHAQRKMTVSSAHKCVREWSSAYFGPSRGLLWPWNALDWVAPNMPNLIRCNYVRIDLRKLWLEDVDSILIRLRYRT